MQRNKKDKSILRTDGDRYINESKIPIVFAFDKNHILPASIAISSLLKCKHAKTKYDIFILHNDIEKTIQEKFSIYGNINWINVDKKYFENVPTNDIWPEIVYYRILIPELITNYDKILYSDVDVLFQGDLSDIYQLDIENYYWSGVIAEKNTPDTMCHKYFPENKNDFIYMTGFMIINSKKMREDKIVNKIFDNIKLFDSRLRFFDLDLLNITCNKICALPFDYCVLENIYDNRDITKAKEYIWLSNVYSKENLETSKKNAAIIHYAGKDIKIWNRSYKNIPRYYWNYIKSSPFYEKEKYCSSLKQKIKYLYYFICSRLAFSKNVRHKYRNWLKEHGGI